jgi:hypothetical protein
MSNECTSRFKLFRILIEFDQRESPFGRFVSLGCTRFEECPAVKHERVAAVDVSTEHDVDDSESAERFPGRAICTKCAASRKVFEEGMDRNQRDFVYDVVMHESTLRKKRTGPAGNTLAGTG